MEINKGNIKKIIGLIVFTVVLVWAINNFEVVDTVFSGIVGVFAPFLIGACLAFLVNVLMRMLEKFWHKRLFKKPNKVADKLCRPVSMVCSIILIVGILFVLIFMLIPQLKEAFLSLIDLLPQFLLKLELWWKGFSEFMAGFSVSLPELHINWQNVIQSVSSAVYQMGQAFIDKTFAVTTSVFSAVVNFAIAIVFSIYILAQKETLARQFTKLFRAYLSPARAEKLLHICNTSNRVFANFVTGQFTEAIIIGVLCFVGMLILSIPYASTISVLVGFTALIPVFGAFIGAGIGAVLILVAEPVKVIWFLVFLIVLQQLEGNLIYPKVVGKSVGLPGIWVLAAVTVGGSAFGFLGMLIGVPVCSVLYCLLQESTNRRLAQKKPKKDGNPKNISGNNISVENNEGQVVPEANSETSVLLTEKENKENNL